MEFIIPAGLKQALEQTKLLYENKASLSSDPILFPTEYSDPKDIEVVAFFSALFAYGNVRSINGFLSNFFMKMRDSPFLHFRDRTMPWKKTWKEGHYYRFQSKEDIKKIMEVVSEYCLESREKPIWEDFFKSSSTMDPKPLQEDFLQKINKPSSGIIFWIGKPGSPSPQKRIHLFLRWMVRRGFPDFGIYKSLSPKDLLFPLDVHIQRLISILGITKKKTFGKREALNVREAFQQLNQEDPLIYDFFLSRIGILHKCRGKKMSLCDSCVLKNNCAIWNGW